MLPSQLKPADFTAYPPQARRIATDNIALLQRLPLAFACILLREIITYDWRFPAERRQLDEQLRLLSALSKSELATKMQGFAAITLSSELERTDWVRNPSGFMEQLTAHLWSTHQMDSFRVTADTYAAYLAQAAPAPRPPAGASPPPPADTPARHCCDWKGRPADRLSALPQAAAPRRPSQEAKAGGRPEHPARRSVETSNPAKKRARSLPSGPLLQLVNRGRSRSPGRIPDAGLVRCAAAAPHAAPQSNPAGHPIRRDGPRSASQPVG